MIVQGIAGLSKDTWKGCNCFHEGGNLSKSEDFPHFSMISYGPILLYFSLSDGRGVLIFLLSNYTQSPEENYGAGKSCCCNTRTCIRWNRLSWLVTLLG